jgi:hypothetical protein
MTHFVPSPSRPTQYGQSDYERQLVLDCRRSHQEHWAVVQRNGNASAFSGYRWTPSAYSGVRCTECGRYWRTKAGYVRYLPDLAREG